MSLDERLREGLGQISAELPPEPIDIGSDLQGVLMAGRRRRVLRQAYRGVAVAVLLFIAVSAGPSLFRQLGIQQVETADDPPADPPAESERDEGLGTTGGPSEKGGAAPRSIGTGGAGGVSSQGGPGAGSSRQAATLAGEKAATPTPPGTYSFDVSGHSCATVQGHSGCGYFYEFELTFEQPTGSHQRHTKRARFRNAEGKNDSEHSDDYRPDGVYWEHFSGTSVNQWGVPTPYACPELEVAPILWWRTGAKPGDHHEYNRTCNDYSPSESETGDREVEDILRAETVSVGGREVVTYFVRGEHYRGANLIAFWEVSVIPAHPRLFVDAHSWWQDDGGYGELWGKLKSLTPS